MSSTSIGFAIIEIQSICDEILDVSQAVQDLHLAAGSPERRKLEKNVFESLALIRQAANALQDRKPHRCGDGAPCGPTCPPVARCRSICGEVCVGDCVHPDKGE
jgi:hypothetical protein